MNEKLITTKTATPEIEKELKSKKMRPTPDIPLSLSDEVKLIPDDTIREWTERAFQLVPKTFWSMPSSISGKYHPEDEYCVGGKVIHTKRAFVALLVLMSSHGEFTRSEKSKMMAAILLHDIGYTYTIGPLHPAVPRMLYATHWGDGSVDFKIGKEIFNLIEAHMGRWSQRPCSPPSNLMEQVVHQADYIVCMRGTKFSTIEDMSSDEIASLLSKQG